MGFAMKLTHNETRAEDLVSATILQAALHEESFEPGTNLLAWLNQILFNFFRLEYRRSKREILDDGARAAGLYVEEVQTWHLIGGDIQAAIDHVPIHSRRAFELVHVEGKSYKEAAKLTGVSLGTVKSRINRAREKMQKELN